MRYKHYAQENSLEMTNWTLLLKSSMRSMLQDFSAIKLLVVILDVVSTCIIVKNLVLFVASILTLFMHLVFF